MNTKPLVMTLAVCGSAILLTQMNVDADPPDLGSTAPNTGTQDGTAIPVGGTPDVIVWDLQSYTNYSQQNGYIAYSCGTTSCNIGTAPLLWTSGNNQHPVIGQNMFRLKDGRFEHIGQSWLKHGFCALDQNACGSCQGTGCGSLGINCSDPYTASRNGSQSNLGPKYQVNGSTGYFVYPPANPSYSGSTARRLRVPIDDVMPSQNPGAQYWVEGQYIHPQDSPEDGGTSVNNASYRKVNLSSNATISGFGGSTVQQVPAITVWSEVDPDADVKKYSITGEGNYWVGYKVTDTGFGTWTYEYAIYNMNSDRSGGAVEFPVPPSVTLTDVGFHGPEYHSGEPYDQEPWTWTHSGDSLRFETESYSDNTNAYAMRWATLYNFRFTADSPPMEGYGNLEFFKPGSGEDGFEFGCMGPDDADPLIAIEEAGPMPELVSPDGGTTVEVIITELHPDGLDPASPRIFVDSGSGSFIEFPLVNLSGDLWQGTLPPADVASEVAFYFTATTSEGTVRSIPPGGANSPYLAIAAYGQEVVIDNTMESDAGWMVTNDASLTGGAWERGVPAGLGDRGDPTVDFDGSGACWLTGNGPGNTDVDGGPTVLTTNVFSLAGDDVAFLSYAHWFTNDDMDSDALDVDISNNGGASWTTVESIAFTGEAWHTSEFRVDELVPQTGQMVMRFSVSDSPNDSVTEAGLDAMKVIVYLASPPSSCPTDIDGNGEVGFDDLLALLGSWGPCAGDCPADVNESGDVGFQDLVMVLGDWGPC